jgi:anti-anti-sigma factor
LTQNSSVPFGPDPANSAYVWNEWCFVKAEFWRPRVLPGGDGVQADPQSAPTWRVSSYQSGCWRVIEAVDELDIDTSPLLHDVLEGTPAHVVFDLSRVTFVDATMLGILATTHQTQDQAHGILRVAGPSPGVRRVRSMTRLDQTLSIFDSLEEALTGHELCTFRQS